MTALLFCGIFRFDLDNPEHPNNDRLIFSKGHASPLFYALWAAAGKVTEQELMTYRKFESPLEGHPTTAFRYTEAATGSLGQGLSIGIGMALNAKYIDKLPYRTYVLLGDSEMAEGSQWEAIQIAAHYNLNNLIGIIDVNRLGQRGETMYGHDIEAYERRISSFGWETITIDGHNFDDILLAYNRASKSSERPVMIIAKTVKGKGVPFIEDRIGWHGKTLDKSELKQALMAMGPVDKSVLGSVLKPEDIKPEEIIPGVIKELSYEADDVVATRMAYGNALKRIFPRFRQMVVLDAEVSNSTFADIFQKIFPERFFEMYVAEQNMVGVALGLSRRGKIPFVSTFAAFFTRAHDQIRMGRYSEANIKFCGSHAGVSIGQDGVSQMGLEDIAMFRSILDSIVLYPSDAVSTERLVEEAAKQKGIVYIRTTREKTPILYDRHEDFPIGKCKVLRRSSRDMITVVASGITLYEALAAHEALEREDIHVRVIDLYCIKPIDKTAFREAIRETRAVVTVEDHYAEGGIGEAVRSAIAEDYIPVHSLAVRKMPKSGRPDELLRYEEISMDAIVKKVKEVLCRK